MAKEDKFSLFGFETPEEVRRRIGRTGYEEGLQAAQMPRGRGGVALARQIPSFLDQAFDLSGEQKKAQMRESALANAFDRSKDDRKNYFKYLAQALNDSGDQQGAFEALQMHQQVVAATAKTELEKEKIQNKYKMDGEKLALKELLGEKRIKIEENKVEIQRLETEIKALAQKSTAGVNDAKVKQLQKQLDVMDAKILKSEAEAESLLKRAEQRDIELGIMKFDADTRRMKLGVDKEIAELKRIAKEKGSLDKNQEKRLSKNFDSYEKFTRSKELKDVVAKMIEDHPEAGSFFANVDEEKMSTLVRGAVLNKIAEARLRGDVDFNYDGTLLETAKAIIDTYTKTGSLMGMDRTEESIFTDNKSIDERAKRLGVK